MYLPPRPHPVPSPLLPATWYLGFGRAGVETGYAEVPRRRRHAGVLRRAHRRGARQAIPRGVSQGACMFAGGSGGVCLSICLVLIPWCVRTTHFRKRVCTTLELPQVYRWRVLNIVGFSMPLYMYYYTSKYWFMFGHVRSVGGWGFGRFVAPIGWIHRLDLYSA